jgi:hypothetical protein
MKHIYSPHNAMMCLLVKQESQVIIRAYEHNTPIDREILGITLCMNVSQSRNPPITRKSRQYIVT